MDQGSDQTKSSHYLRSKRETCLQCEERLKCILPSKDTEDEDVSLYPCKKYTVVK